MRTVNYFDSVEEACAFQQVLGLKVHVSQSGGQMISVSKNGGAAWILRKEVGEWLWEEMVLEPMP
jgi:hypothetical protein